MKREPSPSKPKKRKAREVLRKVVYVAPAIIGSFLLTEAMAQTPSMCNPQTVTCKDGSPPPCS